MDFKEIYFDVWSEVWQFHKKFYDNDGSDQAWQQIVDSAGGTVNKYKGLPQYDFIKDLILAILAELERRDRIKRKETVKNE